MPHFTSPIEIQGPLLNVQIGISRPHQKALTDAGCAFPRPIVAKGLVDTGASVTGIAPYIVNQLNLKSKGSVPVVTPSTGDAPVHKPLYDVALNIYSSEPIKLPLTIAALPVLEIDIVNQGFAVLIGRDVLSQCLLFYNGQIKQYTLSF